MKGGKKGRTRRPSAPSAKGKAASRGAVKKGSARRPWSSAPKKGERVNPYGGRSSSDE